MSLKGLTPADQFNIIILNNSAVVSIPPAGGPSVPFSPTKTTKVEITKPSMSVMEIKGLPCRYEPGKLYKVITETVMFFTTGPVISRWPDQWYADDAIMLEGNVLMFLGIIRYDLNSEINEAYSKSIYALKFLHEEKVVQYPILSLLIADNMDFISEGEGLVELHKEEHNRKIRSNLLVVLKDNLEPV